MDIFKRIFRSFGKSGNHIGAKKLDIIKVLASHDSNNSIIIIDDFICELCSWGENIEELTAQQKNFYYIQNLEREVCNGGFNLYFYNSSGNFSHETIEALKVIKAENTASLLQEAVAQFPNHTVPKNRDERQYVLNTIAEAADEIWEELNQKFFAYEDDLNALNIEYIIQHNEKF